MKKRQRQIQATRGFSRSTNLAKLKEGARAWNAWRAALISRNPDWRPDLRDCDLSGLDLHGRCLRRAILSGANLEGATLWWADLRSAKFRGANLKGTSLWRADVRRGNFDKADLGDARLGLAKLQGARFSRTILDGTDFDGARLGETSFVDVDLSGAKNLGTVNHYSPTFLSYQTLASSGKLPSAFLRGAGLSPSFHRLIASDGTGRRAAFRKLAASPLACRPPQRFVINLFHGRRTRQLQRDLNRLTDCSWHLITLTNASGDLDPRIFDIPRDAPTFLTVNTDYHLKTQHRRFLKQIEKARKRQGFRLILIVFEARSWWDEPPELNLKKVRCEFCEDGYLKKKRIKKLSRETL